jgi:hypothetical protein
MRTTHCSHRSIPLRSASPFPLSVRYTHTVAEERDAVAPVPNVTSRVWRVALQSSVNGRILVAGGRHGQPVQTYRYPLTICWPAEKQSPALMAVCYQQIVYVEGRTA